MGTENQIPKKSCSGFTLIELLLAAALIPVVSFVIYANLSAGIRIWTKLTQQTPVEDINIFYERSSYDFKNIFRYVTIPFTGKEDKVTFATRIDAAPSLGGDRGIGEVTYFYDPRQKAILRQERNVNQIFREAPGETSLLLKDVLSFEKIPHS